VTAQRTSKRAREIAAAISLLARALLVLISTVRPPGVVTEDEGEHAKARLLARRCKTVESGP